MSDDPPTRAMGSREQPSWGEELLPPAPGANTPPPRPSGRSDLANPLANPLVLPLAVGAGVAVALGVYGRLHHPGKIVVSIAGFSGPGYVKAWLTTLAIVLGIVQIVSSLSMWGRLGGWSPSWISTVHRWSGRLAVIATVPVVVHCLYALGFAYDRPRVLMHSVAGCLFYGAFVAKMLALPRSGTPRWTMPVLGGVVFAALVLLWLTSSLWLFNDQGFHL